MQDFADSFGSFAKGMLGRAYFWLFAALLDPLDFYNRFKQPEWPRYEVSLEAFFAVLAGLMLWTAFLTYHDIYTRSRKLSKPALSAEVDHLISHVGEDNRLWIFVCVSVRNQGTPTIAEYWQVHIQRKDDSIEPFEMYALPDEAHLKMYGSETGVLLRRGRDSLQEKGVIPVPQGGIIRGWLHAISSQAMIGSTQNGERLIVKFKDVNGRDYQAEFLFDQNNKHGVKHYADGAGGTEMIGLKHE